MPGTYLNGQPVNTVYMIGHKTTAYYNGVQVWPTKPKVLTLEYTTLWEGSATAGTLPSNWSSYDTVKFFANESDSHVNMAYSEFAPGVWPTPAAEISFSYGFGNATYHYLNGGSYLLSGNTFKADYGGWVRARVNATSATTANNSVSRFFMRKIVGVRSAYV